jgi:CRISPR system Cascade subunit CasD
LKTLLVRLEGPLQSWGTQGRFGIRDTDREPSKSGVLGLLGAALGMARDDDAQLATLRQLSFAVRVDREGTILRDYHTVGGGTFRGQPHGVASEGKAGSTALTQRYYLQDASFLVGLGSDDGEFLTRIGAALDAPRWPLSLGRRSCALSARPFVGIVDGAPREALERFVPLVPRESGRKEELPAEVRLVFETDAIQGAPRQDEPESFALYGRRHLVRYVSSTFVKTEGLVPCT